MSFTDVIGVFLNACPGPPMAKAALHVAAFQVVDGIPGLSAEELSTAQSPRRKEPYLRSMREVGELAGCRPRYLSKAAERFGYSFSRALRWIRFLHGMALLENGARMDDVCHRIGFSDVAGWSRFVTRLVGMRASQLPVLPLEHWVRKAIDDVYFGVSPTGTAHTSNDASNSERAPGAVDDRPDVDQPNASA